MRTLIKARYVVAYQKGGHALLEHGQVVFEDGNVTYVGRSYPGVVDRTIEAPDRLLCPGFITVHSHLTNSPLTKSFLEDQGNPFHYRTVVIGGRIEGVDEERLARDLQGAAERLWQRAPQADWAKRTIDQISPQSLPRWRDG